MTIGHDHRRHLNRQEPRPAGRIGSVGLFLRASLTVVVLAAVGAVWQPNAPSAGADIASQTETFTVGPFDLSAQGHAGDQVETFGDLVPRPDGDVAITNMEFRLVDGDGNQIPSHHAHLHHIVLIDLARPDALCDGVPGSRFAGAGMELTPLTFDGPENYAYISPEGQWAGVYHVMNLSDEPVTAAIEYEITWSDPADDDFSDVEPHFFDVDGCWGDSEYDVPGGGGPGSTFDVSNTYTARRDGVIVGAGPHLHAGAVDLTLEGPDGVLCVGVPEYGDMTAPGHGDSMASGHGDSMASGHGDTMASGHGDTMASGHHGEHGHHPMITAIPACQIDEPYVAGEDYVLTARYDNEHPIPGAMGIMVTYIHFTGPPPPAPEASFELLGLADGSATVEVTCNVDATVWLNLNVSQDKGGVTTSGYGYGNVDCSSEPTTVDVPFTGGVGVLTGGPASYRISGSVSDGFDYTWSEVEGEIRLRGRIDIAARPFDAGTVPVTLDGSIGRFGSDLVVSGTVSCEPGRTAEVWARAEQRVGRGETSVSGWGIVECAGPRTPVEVVLSSNGGRIAGGPVAVTLSTFVFGGGVGDDGYPIYSDFSTGAVREVLRVKGAPPSEQSGRIETDDPDVEIVDVSSSSLTFTVDCAPGASLSSWVTVLSEPKGKGQRLDRTEYSSGSADGTCAGVDTTVTVELSDSISRATWVDVWVGEFTPNGDYDSHQESGPAS